MWDIGGQKAIRPYWKNYYENTDGLVYVVDSSDEVRLKECAEELTNLMTEESLVGVPVLVFANKQDLQFALEAEEVMSTLDLMNITGRTWNIQACSAVTKEGKILITYLIMISLGLQEGMEWLVKTISEKQS